MAKRNTQQMIDELNKKYGVTSTVTTNNGNKGKQGNSASPSVKKDSGKKTKTERTQSAIDSLNKKYGIGTSTTPSLKSSIPSSTSTPSTTKKYSDFNTETKHAYTSVKDKLSNNTTITSNLSDEERNKRIKEIKSEHIGQTDLQTWEK